MQPSWNYSSEFKKYVSILQLVGFELPSIRALFEPHSHERGVTAMMPAVIGKHSSHGIARQAMVGPPRPSFTTWRANFSARWSSPTIYQRLSPLGFQSHKVISHQRRAAALCVPFALWLLRMYCRAQYLKQMPPKELPDEPAKFMLKVRTMSGNHVELEASASWRIKD